MNSFADIRQSWTTGLTPGGRLVVAMSGGVDSSVVAALAKDAGYDVVGITMQLYDHGAATGRKGACCAGQDIGDARAVAAKLAIPHYVLDYEQQFAKDVVGAFAASYRRGETPVPCALCNQKLKFSSLLDTARELGAQALVTGHYIARQERPQGGAILCRPRDVSRDQTYFLFGTRPSELTSLRFPLGDLLKSDVRKIADDLNLPVADKPDSQDLCFVPTGRYTDVIVRLDPKASDPGDIVHVDGRRLGRHAGIVHYTVGQRRGLGVSGGEPLFVVRLDPKRREVVVGPRASLHVDRIMLKSVNWLGDQPVEHLSGEPLEIHVRLRSSQTPQRAVLMLDGSDAQVVLNDGGMAIDGGGISPGQACVFYADGTAHSRLLGGGWISQTERSDSVMTAANIGLRGSSAAARAE